MLVYQRVDDWYLIEDEQICDQLDMIIQTVILIMFNCLALRNYHLDLFGKINRQCLRVPSGSFCAYDVRGIHIPYFAWGAGSHLKQRIEFPNHMIDGFIYIYT